MALPMTTTCRVWNEFAHNRNVTPGRNPDGWPPRVLLSVDCADEPGDTNVTRRNCRRSNEIRYPNGLPLFNIAPASTRRFWPVKKRDSSPAR